MIEDYYNLAELNDEQIRLLRLADKLGREHFAPRTFEHDEQASFPTENYNDLRDHDFLKLCVPKDYGGLGADFWTYAILSTKTHRGWRLSATGIRWGCVGPCRGI